jgi:hypothetical protein
LPLVLAASQQFEGIYDDVMLELRLPLAVCPDLEQLFNLQEQLKVRKDEDDSVRQTSCICMAFLLFERSYLMKR